jgi:hypothetical protein
MVSTIFTRASEESMSLVPSQASIADLMEGRCGGAPADGDVLAFYGKSAVDEFIQEATGSKISHVAVLMRGTPGGALQVLEATGAGVTVTELGKSLAGYAADDHVGFYLPLSDALRARVVPQVLTSYYRSNALDKYNYEGVVEAGLYDLGHPFYASVLQHFGRRSLVGRAVRWWEELRGEVAKIWQTIFLRRGARVPAPLLLAARDRGAPDDRGGGQPARGAPGRPRRGHLVRHLPRRLPAQRRTPGRAVPGGRRPRHRSQADPAVTRPSGGAGPARPPQP